ncbi:unannotated protein [freshwater metagenome]|uniref:Unannotated protein n=1 Tax=freshwater metagenome TaxID=449393 RepID=A0A6J6DV66_9ZZZZ
MNIRSSPDSSDLVSSEVFSISPLAKASSAWAPRSEDLGFRLGQTPSIRPGKTTVSKALPISPEGVNNETHSPEKLFSARLSSGISRASWSNTKSSGLLSGLRSVNLAAAAKSAITESRFFPACIANSDTPREATTQRSISDVPEIKFQSTASVVDSGSLASALV